MVQSLESVGIQERQDLVETMFSYLFVLLRSKGGQLSVLYTLIFSGTLEHKNTGYYQRTSNPYNFGITPGCMGT